MLIQVRFHIKSSVTHFAVQSVDAGVNRLVMSQSFFCTVSFSTVITVEAPSVMFHHVFRVSVTRLEPFLTNGTVVRKDT